MRTRPVILVVDDSLENRQLLGYIFESSGVYQVKYASGGAEAFEMLTTGPGIAADLIVSDVFMPGMDGLELTRRLRQHPQTQFLPLVLITGTDRDGSRENGIAAGCDDFVLKPFAKEEVLTRVRHLVELGSYRRQALQHTLAVHAYETAFYGLIMADASGLVLSWNPMAERFSPGWAAGVPLYEQLAQSYRFSAAPSAFTLAGAPRSPYYFLLTPKGERRHLYACLSPYFYSKVLASELGGFVLSIQDFSPVQRFLSPLDRLLFTATPATLVTARAYLACLKSLGTTESVLVRPLVAEICDQLTQVYPQKKVDWRIDIAESVIWQGPRSVLRMIVAQLADNAVRYCGDEPRILIEGHTDGAEFVMVIKDNGAGVTDQQFNRGSGFQIVRQLVLAVDGMVSLLNPGDPGATFMIRI